MYRYHSEVVATRFSTWLPSLKSDSHKFNLEPLVDTWSRNWYWESQKNKFHVEVYGGKKSCRYVMYSINCHGEGWFKQLPSHFMFKYAKISDLSVFDNQLLKWETILNPTAIHIFACIYTPKPNYQMNRIILSFMNTLGYYHNFICFIKPCPKIIALHILPAHM